jgi:mannosyltransferase OCH1-like enzyme
VIPRIVHHLWPGRDPFRYGAWRESWARHHPDWSLRFWRLTDCSTFVDTRFLEPFSVVVRADLLRWLLLDRYGGIYADTDTEALSPLEPLVGSPVQFFWSSEPVGAVRNTALMGAEPGMPFVQRMAARLLGRAERIGPGDCNLDPVRSTGPFAVTEIERDLGDSQDRLVYPPWFFTPSPKELGLAYVRHHFTGSNDPVGWRSRIGQPHFGA